MTMATAYACILIAALLPYVWAFVAKRDHGYDNRDPRGWLARQNDPRKLRANAAHLNAFEAFAPFAASVLMAQAAGVDVVLISVLSIAFIVLRVLHGAVYIGNQALFRSMVWFGAFACVIALMVLALVRFSG